MTVSEIIFAVFLTATAVSYGWGMRGAVIGGEKGAMLPGALLGLFLAKLSGFPIIADNAYIFSAIGCLAMGYGGFEPYAQTMEMIICPKSDIWNLKRGYTGLMLKGANWFGICGAFLGIGFIAMTGTTYKWFEIVVLCAAIPFLQVLGIKIFNKPYDKKNGVFPKIYFSRNSREEWGGNLLTLLTVLLMTAVKGDWFSFCFGVAGMVSGAIGWAVSIWLYYITCLPLKNGKYILGKLQTKGYVDNWKIMEFSLGLLGGGGLALYFFLNKTAVKDIAVSLAGNGFWNPLGDLQKPVAWVAFSLAVLTIVQYFFKKLSDLRFMELLERAIYFAGILCISILGSTQMSRLVVFMLILWVVLEKNIFDRVDLCKGEKYFKIFCVVVGVLALVGELLLPDGYPMMAMLFMYTFFYISVDAFYAVTAPRKPHEKRLIDRLKRGYALVYGWFCVLSVVILIAAYKLF